MNKNIRILNYHTLKLVFFQGKRGILRAVKIVDNYFFVKKISKIEGKVDKSTKKTRSYPQLIHILWIKLCKQWKNR